MIENSIFLFEKKFIGVSLALFLAAYLGGTLISFLLFPFVDGLEASEYWMIWPVNLYYISQIRAKFGSLDGWSLLLFSNYILSSMMIFRAIILLFMEMNRPKNGFHWGLSNVYIMVFPITIIGLLLPFDEGPNFYGMTFYHGPISNSLKSNFFLAAFYFCITDPLVKLVSWIRFYLLVNR